MPKRKIDTNYIGKRGESIFNTKISKHFLLDPTFLGDKYKAVDFIVDLIDVPDKRAFFFVSVKTTANATYSKKEKRLRVVVEKEELDRLKKFKIPTYIVGVDEGKEKAFIVSVQGVTTQSIASIPTGFSLNKKSNLKALWKEVKLYWENLQDKQSFKSKFKYK